VAKDTYWFPHDANARNDPKVSRLLMLGGQAAKGSYWDIIEILREAADYKIALEELPAIEYACRFPAGAIDQMLEAGLLEQDETHLWSESLMRRMERMDEIRGKRKAAGRLGGKAKAAARVNQKPSKSVASAKQVLDDGVASAKQNPSKLYLSDQIREDQSISDQRREGVDAGVPPDVPTPRKKPKKVKRNTRAAKSTETWEAYSSAYLEKYGTAPVRNAKGNALCCQLVDRLGSLEAPSVAKWYLCSSNTYYSSRGHGLESLVADAEKLRTEWATGKQVTANLETPQQRQRREQIEAADRRIREAEEREKNNGDGTMCVEGRTTIHGRISQDGDLG